MDMFGQQRLKMSFDTVLDQSRIDAQVVTGVVLDILDDDTQLFSGLVLNHPDQLPTAELFGEPARRTHPVQRFVGAVVGVHTNRPVRLDQQQPARGRQMRGEPTDIVDGALSNH